MAGLIHRHGCTGLLERIEHAAERPGADMLARVVANRRIVLINDAVEQVHGEGVIGKPPGGI